MCIAEVELLIEALKTPSPGMFWVIKSLPGSGFEVILRQHRFRHI
jgi:hypothetical protein